MYRRNPPFSLVVVASVLFVSASYGQKLCYPDSNPKTTQAYLLLVLKKGEVEAKRDEQLFDTDWPLMCKTIFSEPSSSAK